MIKSLIYASAKNGAIGRRGGLPWNCPSDLAHFKKVTSGHTVIMGRRTAESIMQPFKGKLLPNRRNIVVSSQMRLSGDVGQVATTLEEAWLLAEDLESDIAYVIGGQKLYEEAIRHVNVFERTYVEVWPQDADTFFWPCGNLDTTDGIDKTIWRCFAYSRSVKRVNKEPHIMFQTWERISERRTDYS